MDVSITASVDSLADTGGRTTVVDALIGYGLSGDIRPPADAYIDRMNERPGPTVSLDIPSGIDATTGEPLGVAVTPDRNISIEDDDVEDFYFLMKLLREWANYKHGGLFSLLYGDGYIKAIDRSLRLLSFSALVTAEVATICSFGLDWFREEVSAFHQASKEGAAESSIKVRNRLSAYEQALSTF